MSKFWAILDENNFVINIVLSDEALDNALEYNHQNPAFIGGDYFDGFFYPSKPFKSWLRNNGEWISPVLKPDGDWSWDEASLSWVERD